MVELMWAVKAHRHAETYQQVLIYHCCICSVICLLLFDILYLKKTNHNCQTVYIVYCLGYYYRYYYLTIPQREEGGVDGPQMFTHHNTWVARLSSG